MWGRGLRRRREHRRGLRGALAPAHRPTVRLPHPPDRARQRIPDRERCERRRPGELIACAPCPGSCDDQATRLGAPADHPRGRGGVRDGVRARGGAPGRFGAIFVGVRRAPRRGGRGGRRHTAARRGRGARPSPARRSTGVRVPPGQRPEREHRLPDVRRGRAGPVPLPAPAPSGEHGGVSLATGGPTGSAGNNDVFTAPLGGDSILVTRQQVATPHGAFTVVATSSLDGVRRSVDTLVGVLVWGIPFLVLGVGLLVWFLVGRSSVRSIRSGPKSRRSATAPCTAGYRFRRPATRSPVSPGR